MIYFGDRTSHAVYIIGDTHDRALNPCNHIRNHSPDGFHWGYEGSGPAQLALAILVSEYGPDLEKHPVKYQDFKRAVIAKFSQDKSFHLHSEQIQDWLRYYRMGQVTALFKLPPAAFVIAPDTGAIVVVKRGEDGYYPLLRNVDLTLDALNAEVGVTLAQREAMLAGSMFGWHVPAADPDRYTIDGELIIPTKGASNESV